MRFLSHPVFHVIAIAAAVAILGFLALFAAPEAWHLIVTAGLRDIFTPQILGISLVCLLSAYAGGILAGARAHSHTRSARVDDESSIATKVYAQDDAGNMRFVADLANVPTPEQLQALMRMAKPGPQQADSALDEFARYTQFWDAVNAVNERLTEARAHALAQDSILSPMEREEMLIRTIHVTAKGLTAALSK